MTIREGEWATKADAWAGGLSFVDDVSVCRGFGCGRDRMDCSK